MKAQTTAVLSILLTGCAVGPNYHRPLVSTPGQWTTSNAQGTKPGAPVDVDQWWRSFRDAELDSLIQRAVTANYDLAQASARVSEARASLGTARSEYSPQINAGELHDLTLGLGNFFSAGPSISVPVFTGGKIRSNVAVQDARVQEALAVYHAAILTALEETENALVSYSDEQSRRDRLSATVEAYQEAFELATVQYKAGLSDFLAVLDAQREMYANQDLLAQSRTQVTTNLIGLYRALGGGWSISPGIESTNRE